MVEVDPLQLPTLARSQMQGQIDNDRKNNIAEDGNQSALRVNHNHGQHTGRDSNNGNDDGSLLHRFNFNLKGKFHAQKCNKEGE